jgi:hypothetical protein
MKIYKSIIKNTFGIMFISLVFIGCQDLSLSELKDYPKDANPVGGPLKFYAAFDGTSTSPLMNAVDSIRAKFPTDNPLASIDGISGKGIQGVSGKFISYAKPNDFASVARSFTVSFWEKHEAVNTKENGTGNNGAEFICSLPSTNGHWSNNAMMIFFEGSPSATAVKVMIVDRNNSDRWLTWEGSESFSGLMDNQWHHCAFVYDEATSGLTFYKDGIKISTKTWDGHGPIDLDDSKVSGLRICSGPTNTGWTSNTWKGGLDQFRMYGTALSGAEVNTLFTKKK